MKYDEFLQKKKITDIPTGFTVEKKSLNKKLIDFQGDCVLWSVRRGRGALFEDCGLGKTFQQLEWARLINEHTGKPVLILCPLSVAKQTQAEGKKFGISVNICSENSDCNSGINITNYEKIHKFNVKKFSGVVLDESSCLKSYTSKYRSLLIDLFKKTPYRLCCTATPSPNDFMELGNHAEFLGIMSRSEMLSMFFINDTGDTGTWRLKKHAVKEFWRWVCSWAVLIRKPSDLGYDNKGFDLPEIVFHEHIIKSAKSPKAGFGLISYEAKTLSERRDAKRESLPGRVKKAAEIINRSDEQWVVWCNLNVESEELKKAIVGSIEVKGSDSDEHKISSAAKFISGDIKTLISKSSIFGFGMNWQHCHNVMFVGLSDSYEEYYQAIRRCWRFGQTELVNVHIISSEAEGAIVKNINKKEEYAKRMIEGMLAEMSPISTKLIRGAERETTSYNPTKKMEIPQWLK